MSTTVSKTAKASMKQAVVVIPTRQPGEHTHTCPACGVTHTHYCQDCPQFGLAYSPCGLAACVWWFNRSVSLRRPGRHMPKKFLVIPGYSNLLDFVERRITELPVLPDIYKPELADLLISAAPADGSVLPGCTADAMPITGEGLDQTPA